MTIQLFLIWLRGHQFTFLTEFILSWLLIFVFSLFYIVDWLYSVLKVSIIILRWRTTRRRRCQGSNNSNISPTSWWLCHNYIPLTPLPQTKKRYSISTQDRFDQLINIINKQQSKATKSIIANPAAATTAAVRGEEYSHFWRDDQIVATIQNDLVARNLVSLIMADSEILHNRHGGDAGETAPLQPSSHPLLKQLQRLWPTLLTFPTSTTTISTTTNNDTQGKQQQQQQQQQQQHFEISLIIPAYKEKAEDIQSTLTNAIDSCDNPQDVQVIIVDAGGCHDLSELLLCESKNKLLGSFEVCSYSGGGGRGSTLNFGASKGKGDIFTFLHSDTILPKNWDTMVISTFEENVDKIRVSVCAFSMGIDLSQNGLKGGRCPPGIVGADRILGYLRCKLCSLPYGDSALSFPASVFHYLGGYPDQPLMEDYEIITLLRKRAILLDERIVVLPARIQCSPRRWQAYGVCYTILVNLLCIRRYKSGATTEDLFEFYYKQPTKKIS